MMSARAEIAISAGPWLSDERSNQTEEGFDGVTDQWIMDGGFIGTRFLSVPHRQFLTLVTRSASSEWLRVVTAETFDRRARYLAGE